MSEDPRRRWPSSNVLVLALADSICFEAHVAANPPCADCRELARVDVWQHRVTVRGVPDPRIPAEETIAGRCTRYPGLARKLCRPGAVTWYEPTLELLDLQAIQREKGSTGLFQCKCIENAEHFSGVFRPMGSRCDTCGLDGFNNLLATVPWDSIIVIDEENFAEIMASRKRARIQAE